MHVFAGFCWTVNLFPYLFRKKKAFIFGGQFYGSATLSELAHPSSQHLDTPNLFCIPFQNRVLGMS